MTSDKDRTGAVTFGGHPLPRPLTAEELKAGAEEAARLIATAVLPEAGEIETMGRNPSVAKLPPNLPLESIEDRAVDLARSLDGLRASDAVAILASAREYVLRASVSNTALIPDRKTAEDEVERCRDVFEVEWVDGKPVKTARPGRLWRPATPDAPAKGER